MKKIILVLISQIILPMILFASWENYTDINFDQLKNAIDETTKDEGAKNALTFYSEKYKLKIKFTNYPVALDGETIYNRDIFAKISNNELFSTKCNSQVTYKYKNYNYVFIFQDSLVKDFKEKVKLTTEVELYILLASYNDFHKTVYLFVNGFDFK